MRPAQPRLPITIPVALAAITFATGACGPSGTAFEITGLGGGFGTFCAASTPTVARIRVQPSQVNLRLGFQVWIEAMPVDSLGQVAFCAPMIEWSSANPSIATVSAGLVVGIGAGKTYIRASSGGKVDSAEVNVVATTIGSVTIESVPAALLVGQTAALVLDARDTEGNIISPRSIVWRTADATVATISNTGMLITLTEGMATVTVEAEGLTGVARIPITRDPPTRRFRQIATGREHTCAIVGGGGIPDGTAFCWGRGTVGQLGVGGTGYAREPMRVSGGGGYTFASIAVADNSSCAVAVSGETYCWGKNDAGQLGDGTTVDRTVPVRVATTLVFRSLAFGPAMVCGLTPDGLAYCWGRVGGSPGQPPTLVPGGIRFVELTGAGTFVCGRTSAGRAYCWGSASTWAGPTPTAPRGDLLFSQISASTNHVCGIAIADGLGYCWGDLFGRTLGPSIPDGTRDTPVLVPGGLRYTSLAAGGGFTCGVTMAGSYCLGASLLTTSVGGPSPVPIPQEDRHRFVTISGGSSPPYACAIDTNGGGWCWGTNWAGRVGAGDFNAVVTEPLQLRIQ